MFWLEVSVRQCRPRADRLRFFPFNKPILISSFKTKEDAQKRQIVGIGFWPFVKSEEEVLWLHFRCSAIALFKILKKEGGGKPPFSISPMRELPTNYYGFCRAICDKVGSRMFIPDYEDLNSVLRLFHGKGAERIYIITEEFMNKNLVGRKKEENTTNMFKGMVAGMELTSDECQIFLAFEDSTVCVFDLQTKQVIDALKHPKHHNFLCWAVHNIPFSPTSLIVVSVVGQLYLLSHSPKRDQQQKQQQQLEAHCRIRKCTANANCTAITFLSPDFSSFVVGLENGLVEIYSLHFSANRWLVHLDGKCSNAHQKAVHCLSHFWFTRKTHPEEENTSTEGKEGNQAQHSPLLILSGASDNKLVFHEYKYYKLLE